MTTRRKSIPRVMGYVSESSLRTRFECWCRHAMSSGIPYPSERYRGLQLVKRICCVAKTTRCFVFS